MEATATPTTTSQPQLPAQQPPQFAMDTADISALYTNFCHVTFLPEELVLDFGLNTQMQPQPGQPVKLSHRVVMNFYTAKRFCDARPLRGCSRLLHGLQFAVSRYEAAFGALELDFQKRARPQG